MCQCQCQCQCKHEPTLTLTLLNTCFRLEKFQGGRIPNRAKPCTILSIKLSLLQNVIFNVIDIDLMNQYSWLKNTRTSSLLFPINQLKTILCTMLIENHNKFFILQTELFTFSQDFHKKKATNINIFKSSLDNWRRDLPTFYEPECFYWKRCTHLQKYFLGIVN